MEALGVHIKRKYEKLDKYAHALILLGGRLIQYATGEITYSIGKDPTHLGANFLESPKAKEEWVVLM